MFMSMLANIGKNSSEYPLLLDISRLDSFEIISTTVTAKCHILLTSSVSQNNWYDLYNAHIYGNSYNVKAIF